MDKIRAHLFKPTTAHLLALFRIAFGLFMVYDILYFMDVGMVEMGLIKPDMLFKYDGLEWITPFSEPVMDGLLTVAMVAAATFALGLYSQVSIAIFWLIFTYFFLQDKAFYNNHLYLFSLLSFVMIFMKTDAVWSLRNMVTGRVPKLIPQWNYDLLKFHFLIVYFYGGIEKLTYDWLVRWEPMRSVLVNSRTDFPNFIISEPSVAFFTYGGLLFDLLAGFLLWNKRTRMYTIPVVIFFNIFNHLMFDDIGSFPFIMMVSTIIFFSPDAVVDRFRSWGIRIQAVKESAVALVSPKAKQLTVIALAVYCFIQVVLPFKPMVLPGDRDWLGTGHRFCWHMKVQTRAITWMEFAIMDPQYNEPIPVDFTTFINTQQAQVMAQDHAMVVQFCKFLKEEAKARGMVNVRVLADIQVEYNGRKSQYFVDPQLDLSEVEIPLIDVPFYVFPLEE